jgi:glutamate racemase
MADARPIGVFDSGVGGLTVLAALLARLPGERFVYLGDTARLPYGAKTPATVERYSLQCARHLVDRDVKALVIACNTAAAVAVGALASAFAPLEVIGVLEPGADAAVAASPSGRIAVLATEGTIAGGAYERAIRARRADAVVQGIACPLFVALAEEGLSDGPIVTAAVGHYLSRLAPGVDTVLLGCTHFPVLAPALAAALGTGCRLVDSAATTAAVVAARLAAAGLTTPAATGEPAADRPWVRFLATDGADRFARVGRTFFGAALDRQAVELVDLNG